MMVKNIANHGKLKQALIQLAARVRAQVGFRFTITLLFLALQIAIGVPMLLTVYQDIQESKLRDVWAIMFLEMERTSRSITAQVKNSYGKSDGRNDSEESLCSISLQGRIKFLRGVDYGIRSLADLAIENVTDIQDLNFVFFRGKRFILRSISQEKSNNVLVSIRPEEYRIRLKEAVAASKHSLIYIATRQGRLIYTNSAKVSDSNLVKRSLVQQFINMSIWKAQIDLEKINREPYYGFFNEVSGTNLILFTETAKLIVSEPVKQLVTGVAKQVAWAVGAGILVLQVILFILMLPIGSLLEVTRDVGKGKFDAVLRHTGIGELHQLATTMTRMISELRERDHKIHKLMREQAERIRLSQEFETAKKIQDSLLPRQALSADSGLMMQYSYVPATEVAGDWFNFAYDSESQTTVISLVDISGHGAGASMYTAMAAALFSDFSKKYFSGSYDDEQFFRSLDETLAVFGQGAWSASAQMLIFQRRQSTVTIINAGHPFPIIKPKAKDPSPSRLPSTILGVSASLEFGRKKLVLETGTSIVIYTDGLSERKRKDGRQLGPSGIRRILAKIADDSPSIMLQTLKSSVEQFAQGEAPGDDTCIAVVQVA